MKINVATKEEVKVETKEEVKVETKEEVSDRKGHRECAKRTKIAFLKTHKCASSSVQNILMRFGLENELNFVLPSAGNYLGR